MNENEIKQGSVLYERFFTLSSYLLFFDRDQQSSTSTNGAHHLSESEETAFNNIDTNFSNMCVIAT